MIKIRGIMGRAYGGNKALNVPLSQNAEPAAHAQPPNLPFKAQSNNWWPNSLHTHSLDILGRLLKRGIKKDLELKLLKTGAAKQVIFNGLCSDTVGWNLPIYLLVLYLQLKTYWPSLVFLSLLSLYTLAMILWANTPQ